MEFHDYHAASDSELPAFHHRTRSFLGCYGRVRLVTDEESFCFGLLSKGAKWYLFFPSQNNGAPERLFSMARKIETELRKQLDPSTVCDVKVNNHGQSVLWKPTLMTMYAFKS